MSAKKVDNKPQNTEIAVNPLCSTLFCDVAVVSRRRDGTILMRFCNQDLIPNVLAEQARVVVTCDHAKRIVDVLQRQIDLVPDQPAKRDSGSGKDG
jgi:hypothetical protein